MFKKISSLFGNSNTKPPESNSFDEAFTNYLSVIEKAGSLIPKVIKSKESMSDLEALSKLDKVFPPAELFSYFRRVDGIDSDLNSELDLFMPDLAWGMSPLSQEDCVSHYDDSAGCGGEENPDYWPYGFIPILWDGSGSYLLVNCIESSKTYGAVYDMSEGVGCNRVSNSLREFFDSSTAETKVKVRTFNGGNSTFTADYLEKAAGFFRYSPYFARPGRMGDSIIDWH